MNCSESLTIGDLVFKLDFLVTYSKISDDSWYGANDTIITAKQTEDLSIQSNIYIYKETEASAEIPQIYNVGITIYQNNLQILFMILVLNMNLKNVQSLLLT